MAIPGSLLTRIGQYEQDEYSADDILSGLEQSTNYPDIAQKVKDYRSQGYGADEILAGIKASPVMDDSEAPSISGEIGAGIRRGIPQLKESAYGMAGILGSMTGIKPLQEWGIEGAGAAQKEAQAVPAAVPTLSDIQTPSDFVLWASSKLGEQIPVLGETALTTIGGGIFGSMVGPQGTIGGAATGLFGRHVIKGLIKDQVRELTKAGMQKDVAALAAEQIVNRSSAKVIGQKLGAMAGMAGGVLPMESGGNYMENYEKGIDAPVTALLTGAAATALEFAGGGSRLIGKVLDPTERVKAGLVTKLLKNAVQQPLEEASQEAGQELLSMVNLRLHDPNVSLTDKAALLRIGESAAAGGLVGGVFAAGGTAIEATRKEVEPAKDKLRGNREARAFLDELFRFTPQQLQGPEAPPAPATPAVAEAAPAAPEGKKGLGVLPKEFLGAQGDLFGGGGRPTPPASAVEEARRVLEGQEPLFRVPEPLKEPEKRPAGTVLQSIGEARPGEVIDPFAEARAKKAAADERSAAIERLRALNVPESLIERFYPMPELVRPLSKPIRGVGIPFEGLPKPPSVEEAPKRVREERTLEGLAPEALKEIAAGRYGPEIAKIAQGQIEKGQGVAEVVKKPETPTAPVIPQTPSGSAQFPDFVERDKQGKVQAGAKGTISIDRTTWKGGMVAYQMDGDSGQLEQVRLIRQAGEFDKKPIWEGEWLTGPGKGQKTNVVSLWDVEGKAPQAPQVLHEVAGPENTVARVYKHEKGFSVSVTDKDAQEMGPITGHRIFPTFEAAKRYADEIQVIKEADEKVAAKFEEARKSLAKDYNVQLHVDKTVDGKRFLRVTENGKPVNEITGVGYTEAGIEEAVDWFRRNRGQKPAPPKRKAKATTPAGPSVDEIDLEANVDIMDLPSKVEQLQEIRKRFPHFRTLEVSKAWQRLGAHSFAKKKSKIVEEDLRKRTDEELADYIKAYEEKIEAGEAEAPLRKKIEAVREEIKRRAAGRQLLSGRGGQLPTYGASNTVFTQDAAEKARELLKKKLSQLNVGLDPEMMLAGITLAGYHVEAGARQFAAYAAAMVGDLGENVKPYLKGWYLAVRNYPGFDNAGMETEAEIDAAEKASETKEKEKTLEKEKKSDIIESGGPNAPLGETGNQPLAGASTEEIPGAEGVGEPGEGGARGGEADREGDEGTAGEGGELPRSVATGERTIPVSTGGTGPGEGASPVRGGVQPDSGLGEGAAGTQPGAGLPGKLSPQPTNYTITEADRLGQGGPAEKYRDNIAAIKLIKQLEEEGRQATPEEQATLARYVGWGGLKAAFPNEKGEYTKGWEKKGEELKALLTDEEYQTAYRSILDAHYTSEPIIKAIYNALRRFGFTGGKVLEPSMGVGNFFGLMPHDMRNNSLLTGVELDNITSAIAKQLYPNANILAPLGFQDAKLADDYFDLAIGNPPFGKRPIPHGTSKHLKGFTIHNYFFAKSLDKVRPGGIQAMVISRWMLDKLDWTQREYIAHRSRFLGAIRLPNTAFQQNALTEVVTDVIFLQKLSPAEYGTADDSWIKTDTVEDPMGGSRIRISSYFVDNPHMMLGRMERSGKMHAPGEEGEVEPTLAPREGMDMDRALTEAINSLPENVMVQSSTVTPTDEMVRQSVAAGPGEEIGSYQIDEKGQLWQIEEAPDGSAVSVEITPTTQWTEKTVLGQTRYNRLAGMVKIRNSVRKLLKLEVEDAGDMAIEEARAELNAIYDAFQKEYGYLNDGSNASVFYHDPDSPLLLALEANYERGISRSKAKKLGIAPEKPSAQKATIFTKRVITPYRQATRADTPADALTITLAEMGRIDLKRICDLCGKTQEEVIDELHTNMENPVIFRNPETEEWETAATYLSGNVKAKEKIARMRGLDKNADALRNVFPPDLRSADMKVRFGASWVDARYYQDFAKHIFGPDAESRVRFLPATGGFAVSFQYTGEAEEKRWGTAEMGAERIFEKALNSRSIVVYYPRVDRDTPPEVNREATELARQKADELREEFENWIFEDVERRDALMQFYNDNFNTNVPPKFDGSHLTFPGKVPDDLIKLRRHQRNAVWRSIQQRTVLLDHVVGAGKTFTMVATAMELKRMGLVRKPMFVVPNHLVKQWASDFYRLYPGAKVLTMTKKDFQRRNRQKMLARIATGEWDAVILAHSSYGFIPVNRAWEASFINEQIQDILGAIAEVREAEGKGSRRAKQLQEAKERLEGKLQELSHRPKDNLLKFEELGVDQLFVDESHAFKNLYFTTAKQLRGLGNAQGSKRAFDMFMKTQWLLRNQAGKGVIFATGTPVSNSLSELYTLQRYLGLPELRERNIHAFDAWLNNFGLEQHEYELDSTAVRFKNVNRLRNLSNMGEIMNLFGQYADGVSNDQIQQAELEETGKNYALPKIAGGKRQNRVIDRSEAQASYFDQIVERAIAVEAREVDPRVDNLLRITTHARQAALDMRLIDPSFEDNPIGKLHVAADKIKEIYEKSAGDRGTQLVFCDLSIPLNKAAKAYNEIIDLIRAAEAGDEEAQEKLDRLSPDDLTAAESALRGFSAYDDLKDKLIRRGIPEGEIAFIHDYNTDDRKLDLFDMMNQGRIRVLLGSTEKMGAGMNVQKRLVALHHIDCPWRPSDIEQREGRIIRQGNALREKYGDNFEVDLIAYATEQTYDARMWQVQEQKLVAISGLRNYKGEREMEEVSAQAASAAEMKAASTGNPLILEEVQLKEKIRKLDLKRKAFKKERWDAESDERRFNIALKEHPAAIERARKDTETWNKYRNDPFEGNPPRGTVEGKEYRSRTDAEAAAKAARLSKIGGLEAEDRANRDMEATIAFRMKDSTTWGPSQTLKGDNAIMQAITDHPDDAVAIQVTVPFLNDGKPKEYVNFTYAGQFVSSGRTQLKKEYEKAETFSVEINGQQYTSKSAIENALRAHWGDYNPFAMVIDGKRYIQLTAAERAANDLLVGKLPEYGKVVNVPIGTLGDFRVSLDIMNDPQTAKSSGQLFTYKVVARLEGAESWPSGEFATNHPGDAVTAVLKVGSNISYQRFSLEHDLERAQKQMPVVQEILKKQFPSEEEYKAAVERLAVVQGILHAQTPHNTVPIQRRSAPPTQRPQIDGEDIEEQDPEHLGITYTYYRTAREMKAAGLRGMPVWITATALDGEKIGFRTTADRFEAYRKQLHAKGYTDISMAEDRQNGRPTPTQLQAVSEGPGVYYAPDFRSPSYGEGLTPEWAYINLLMEMSDGKRYSAYSILNELLDTQGWHSIVGRALLANVPEQLKNLSVMLHPDRSYYSSETHTVYIKEGQPFEIFRDYVLHEIVHGLSSAKILADPQLRLKLREMVRIARAHAPAGVKELLEKYPTAKDMTAAQRAGTLKEAGVLDTDLFIAYALQNEQEFLAMTFESPIVQEFLKGIEHKYKGSNTLWERFVSFVKHLLNIEADNTMLEAVIRAGGEIFAMPQPQRIRDIVNPERLDVQAVKDAGKLLRKSSVREATENVMRIKDEDLKRISALSTPWWSGKKFKQYDRAVKIELQRQEDREEMFHAWTRKDDGSMHSYLELQDHAKVTKALFDGDAENKRYSADELKKKGLSPQEIGVYNAVRDSFDSRLKDYLDHVEWMTFRPFEKQPWFAQLKAVVKEQMTFAEAIKQLTQGKPKKEAQKIEAHFRSAIHDVDPKRAIMIRYENKPYYAELREATLASTPPHRYREIFKEMKEKYPVHPVPPPGLKEALPTLKYYGEFVKAWKEIRFRQPSLVEFRNSIGQIKGYMPRVRAEGDYYVRVYMPDPNKEGRTIEVHMEKAANRIAAGLLQTKLQRDPRFKGATVEVTILHQTPEGIFQSISGDAVEAFINKAIERAKKKGDIKASDFWAIRENMLRNLADEFKARGWGKRAIKRQKERVITGYETEKGKEIFMSYMAGLAGLITKQRAAVEFTKVLRTINIDTQSRLFEEISKYSKDMLRNDTRLEKAFSKLRGLAFMWYLAGSPKAAFMQFTQNFVTGMPYLSREMKGKFKFLPAIGHYSKAMADVTFNHYTPEEKAALERAINRGVTYAQYTDEVMGKVREGLPRAWRRVADMLAWFFRHAEIKNRQAAFLAMWRVQKASGVADDVAYEKARDYVADVHYLYGKPNLPSALRSGSVASEAGHAAYTFRGYTHNYLLSMVNAFRDQDGNITKESVQSGIGVVGRSLAMIGLFGGLAGLPFLDDLLDDLEGLTGVPYRKQVRNALKGLGGEVLARMGVNGLPALLGVNISASLQIGLPSISDPLKGAEEAVYGVWGGLGKKIVDALHLVARGDSSRALERLSPTFVESVMKAAREHDRGVTTTRGKIVYDESGKPIKLTGAEAIKQAAGFRPIRATEVQEERRIADNVKRYFNEERDKLYGRYRLAKTDEERKAVLKDVSKYNVSVAKYRGGVPKITAESLRRQRATTPRRADIKMTRALEGV